MELNDFLPVIWTVLGLAAGFFAVRAFLGESSERKDLFELNFLKSITMGVVAAIEQLSADLPGVQKKEKAIAMIKNQLIKAGKDIKGELIDTLIEEAVYLLKK